MLNIIKTNDAGRLDGDNAGDFEIKWTAINGWRGYNKVIPTKKSGWQLVKSDWITDNWSDAPEGNSSEAVEEELNKLNAKVKAMGGEMVVIFTPTSNLFSTGYDVFVRNVKLCNNCKTNRTTDLPVSDETGNKYCPSCNVTI